MIARIQGIEQLLDAVGSNGKSVALSIEILRNIRGEDRISLGKLFEEATGPRALQSLERSGCLTELQLAFECIKVEIFVLQSKIGLATLRAAEPPEPLFQGVERLLEELSALARANLVPQHVRAHSGSRRQLSLR